MAAAKSLAGKAAGLVYLAGCLLFSAGADPLPVRLLSDTVYAQLVPRRSASVSSQLAPCVRYHEEVVLENGDKDIRLRFYSEEDPASPPAAFRAWVGQTQVRPVRETAPEELLLLGEKSGCPVRYAWTMPLAFAAHERKRIRIEAEYPVQPVPDRPDRDRFETYFSCWGWRPAAADLLFHFDLAPMTATIPCLGRAPAPALGPWLFSAWCTIRPAGYESRGFAIDWRFPEAQGRDRCTKIYVEWPAWYR